MTQKEHQQQAFDINWRHFVEEGGKPSYEGGCVFFKDRTCRCAIGLLIPDDLGKRWDAKYNGWMFAEIAEADREAKSLAIKYGIQFLSDLQYAHDTPASADATGDVFTSRMKINLIDLAAKYHLQIPEPAAV